MIKLKSVEIKERRDSVDLFIGEANLNEFNLLISDNAQGKTRFFNVINYLSKLSNNKAHPLTTNFWSRWEFDDEKSNSTDTFTYELQVIGLHDKNNYYENIYKNKKLIFSSRQNILIDESKQRKRIENFYLPVNTPAIVSITEPNFRTIGLIRNYFQRIVYISSNKSREIFVDPNSLIPNQEGTNISSVLNNWNDKYPHLFNEVISEFQNRFQFIKKVYFTDQDTQQVLRTKILTFDENLLQFPIKQSDWSDGLFRMLFLIMSVKIPFMEGEKNTSPSLVMVDEIENGLDYKSLKFILNYFQDYSNDIQIALSSHSPLVCELIHPKNWIVVKRNGAKINFLSPKEMEEDLDSQLDLFKQKHWDLYTKHISNSNIYQD